MSTVPAAPIITPSDRLGLTFCLAVMTHAIIILGVTFTGEDDASPRYETMEIVLVQQSDPEPAEDAKLLAQANQQGGGETGDTSPATPLPPPFPDQQAVIAAPPELPAPPPEPEPEKLIDEIAPENADLQTVDERIAAQGPEPEVAADKPQPEQAEPKVRNPITSATALLRKSFEIASLSARIERKLEQKSQRPKRKYISASTQESIYAAYMDAWRAKVERVGNLNYPEEARKQKISGSLVLEVALNADGTINEVIISRPSGHKILDDAAVRIVELAAPYAPFPEDIRKETDVLHIIRTWRYKSGSFQ